MSHRRIANLLVAGALVGCAGGPPSPPALAYDVPGLAHASYAYDDDMVVSVSAMGQALEVNQQGSARFGVDFAPATSGVDVTLTVEDLDVTLSQPMGAPIHADESMVDGTLGFSLDRRGYATISTSPRVEAEASQMVSGPRLAHTFFPRLPGRAVVPGDAWVDTVSYEGEQGPGSASERLILSYLVVGDTVVSGRSLLTITFDGTSESSSEMEMGGMTVSQESDQSLEGHVLWDLQAGMMFESVTVGTGTGRVSVPIVPTPLPIRIETTRRARLVDM